MRRLYAALLIASLGCSGSGSGAQADRADQPEGSPAESAPTPVEPAPVEPDATAPKPEPPGPPANKGGTDELHELEGQPREAMLERFGEPTHEREFAMADCCHEFKIELYNTYPPGKGHDAVMIHEWTWDYDGYALTIWLHEQAGQWRVLETIRYLDTVEF